MKLFIYPEQKKVVGICKAKELKTNVAELKKILGDEYETY